MIKYVKDNLSQLVAGVFFPLSFIAVMIIGVVYDFPSLSDNVKNQQSTNTEIIRNSE